MPLSAFNCGRSSLMWLKIQIKIMLRIHFMPQSFVQSTSRMKESIACIRLQLKSLTIVMLDTN